MTPITEQIIAWAEANECLDGLEDAAIHSLDEFTKVLWASSEATGRRPQNFDIKYDMILYMM